MAPTVPWSCRARSTTRRENSSATLPARSSGSASPVGSRAAWRIDRVSGIAFDPERSAVLSMDLQTGVVSVYVKDEAFIPRVAAVLDRARRAGLLVVHVKVGFRPNVPEASPRNVFLSAVKASDRHQRFFQGDSGAIHPAIAPAGDDLVVTKTRVSAFAGTDLDL